MSEVDAKPPQENPLVNILINVLLPVLALDHLSKDPVIVESAKPWHLGPVPAVIIALSLPIGYGIWFFIRHRQANFFSAIGICSVLLNGGLIFYLWNSDGTIKPNAAQLFGLKEGSIPLILGATIFLSHWTRTPLLNTFLYSPQIFDIKRIEQEIHAADARDPYARLLFSSTILFACSFIVSTVVNFFLALHFLGGIDPDAADAQTQFAKGVSRLTWWGFIVIGVPILVVLAIVMMRLVKGLGKLTGLETEEILLPR